MADRWTLEQVVAAAPDPSSVAAARKLLNPAKWSGTGTDGPLVWGQCQGSGKTPYTVSVDTDGPRYRCSCPSRKFPCKHGLALLMMWADGALAQTGEMSEDLRAWGAKGAPATQAEPARELTAEEVAARAEKAEQRRLERDARMDEGMAELVAWLDDLAASGFARLSRDPYALFDEKARRMVDAQAAALGEGLIACGSLVARGEDGWSDDLLARLALMRALASAWLAREGLDPRQIESLRTHLGVSQRTEDALETPAVRDTWVVLGLHDMAQANRVTARHVWLRGRTTGRDALVLMFARAGAAFDDALMVGHEVDADVHFYPALGQRAVVGARHGDQVPAVGVEDLASPCDVAALQQAWVRALAEDPWAHGIPALVRGRVVLRRDESAILVDATGRSVALRASADGTWALVGQLAQGEGLVWGELDEDGFTPLSVLVADGPASRLAVV